MDYSFEELRARPLEFVRSEIRADRFQGHTAGLATGKLQCNLVILPQEFQADFHDYCLANTKPCPLLATSEIGVPHLPTLGADIDLRTDLPRYYIHKNGRLTESVTNISELWGEHMSAFAIGCSFTFERALIEAGIPVRHIECNTTVPMFRSSIQTNQVGPFGGELVVTMRPLKTNEINRAFEICENYAFAHGGPIHVGNPQEIGIDDLQKPDWGDAVPILPGEVPVFWGCGVTTQTAIFEAKPPICITHAPGSMLITDVDELAYGDPNNSILMN